MHTKAICSRRIFAFYSFLLILIFLGEFSLLLSQETPELITRQQAIDIIVKEIIKPAELDHHTIVFLVKEPVHAGSRIWPYFEDRKNHEITKPTWFAWINDRPRADFAHDTRYVYLDAQTGIYDVKSERWWPVLDGQSLWMTDDEWRDRDLVIYSTITIE